MLLFLLTSRLKNNNPNFFQSLLADIWDHEWNLLTLQKRAGFQKLMGLNKNIINFAIPQKKADVCVTCVKREHGQEM